MTIHPDCDACHPIEFPVHIRYRKRRFYCARGHSLSDQGLCIDVRHLTLPPGTLIDLEIHAADNDWLIEATVVRNDGSGSWIRFSEPQPELANQMNGAGSLPLPARIQHPRDGDLPKRGTELRSLGGNLA